jgi:acylphosphatase
MPPDFTRADSAAGAARPSGRERLDATAFGRVQGVGFRFFVMGVASGLDVDGWVANGADGSVRCVAEGDRRELERLLAALNAGPPGARVDRVAVQWGSATGVFEGFGLRSGAHRGD